MENTGEVIKNGGPEMKIEMIQDEFDKYFARAAIGCDVTYDPVGDSRRGSLPSASLKAPETTTSSASMRRTASCKYPSRRRRSRDKSASPRNMSPSPKQRPSSINMEGGNSLMIGDSYIHEATLRAPSPGLGMKCHSAPHSRSSSWKKSKRPRGRDTDQERLEGRPRTGSVPLEDSICERLRLLQTEDICPVRTFTTSSRGLVNRGDSFKRRSNQSVASEGGSCGSGNGNGNGEGSNRSRAVSVNSQGSNSQASSDVGHPLYKVMMLGDHGTGKTALIQQFMTSEYMGATDTSFDDEGEVTVSVMLDGEETTLDFTDVSTTAQNLLNYGEVDAYILVYSITDRNTFQKAVDLVHRIRNEDGRRVASIMVANKSDLVRTRQVTEEEAKEFCMMYECKYIETSAVLNHKVDDLLVGIVTQIKLNSKRSEKQKKAESRHTQGGASCVTKSAKGLIEKLFKKQSFVSKSCDNLLVL